MMWLFIYNISTIKMAIKAGPFYNIVSLMYSHWNSRWNWKPFWISFEISVILVNIDLHLLIIYISIHYQNGCLISIHIDINCQNCFWLSIFFGDALYHNIVNIVTYHRHFQHIIITLNINWWGNIILWSNTLVYYNITNLLYYIHGHINYHVTYHRLLT